MDLFTKEQATHILFRPVNYMPEYIIIKCVNVFLEESDCDFVEIFRKETGLNLCKFAPGLFYIKYDN